MLTCHIQKLVFGGHAIGHANNKTVFAWNALPQELVALQISKNKRDFISGIASTIIEPSAVRVNPHEDHFLSCSPWQILDYKEENRQKGIVAHEQFEKIARIPLLNTQIVHDEQQYNYRNKIEYSFCENQELCFAFFKRNSKIKTPIQTCELAQVQINAAALDVLEWLKNCHCSPLDLKSLIIRSSATQVVACLFVTDKKFPKPPSLPKLHGFFIYYSSPKSPASIPEHVIYKNGIDALSIKVLNTPLTYSPLAFFQVNIPLFEKVLKQIETFLCAATVVDFYSGVGAISIPLQSVIKECILVESDEEAKRSLIYNIKANNLTHFKPMRAMAESLTEEIKRDRVIIFDPPRAGLHPKIIKRILVEKPRRIIYLSCNVATQARDIGLFRSHYKLTFNKLYNFFPRTPHIESLCVMDAI